MCRTQGGRLQGALWAHSFWPGGKAIGWDKINTSLIVCGVGKQFRKHLSEPRVCEEEFDRRGFLFY